VPTVQPSERQRAELEAGLLRLWRQSEGLIAVQILRRSDLFAIGSTALLGHALAQLVIKAAGNFLSSCACMHCLTCPRKLGKPSAVVHQGDTQDGLGMGLCRRRGTPPEEKLRPGVFKVLKRVFPDGRKLDSAHPAGHA